MGCNCRKSSGSSRASRLSRPSPVRTKQQTLCSRLESLGDSVGVRVGAHGRLFLSSPLGTGSGLPVSSLLPSLSCRGSYSKALLALELKMMGVFLDKDKLAALDRAMPHRSVKLGYLRTVLIGL